MGRESKEKIRQAASLKLFGVDSCREHVWHFEHGAMTPLCERPGVRVFLVLISLAVSQCWPGLHCLFQAVPISLRHFTALGSVLGSALVHHPTIFQVNAPCPRTALARASSARFRSTDECGNLGAEVRRFSPRSVLIAPTKNRCGSELFALDVPVLFTFAGFLLHVSLSTSKKLNLLSKSDPNWGCLFYMHMHMHM